MKLPWKRKAGKLDIDIETLEKVKEEIEDVLFELKTKRKQDEHKAKMLFQKNEVHPVLLMKLKRSKIFIESLTNFSELIDSMIDTVQFSGAIKKIQSDKSMQKVAEILSNISVAMKDVNNTLRDMMKQQGKFINSSMGIITSLTSQQESLNEVVETFSEDILGDLKEEVLKDLVADDPKFAETLPVELKKKYRIST